MSPMPPRNRTVWLPAPKADPIIAESPMPTASGSEVIIKVGAVAINPCDWAIQVLGKLLKPEDYPYVNGCDVAGVVVSLGPQNTRFQIGDRVTAIATVFELEDPKYGAFQEYVVGTEPLMAKIPDSVSFAEAAVLPLTLCTAACSLFMKDRLGLELPRAGTAANSKAEVLLVWGGSSSVGCNAIQAAKAAGYTVAATASPKNFGLMRSIGTDYVFDYNGENVVDEIVSALQGKEKLAGVFDAIITEPTIRACAEIASRLEGKKHVGTVLAPGMPPPTGTPEGVEISVGACTAIRRSDLGSAIWAEWLPEALADGSMLCKPDPEIVGKGLERIRDAVEAMGKGVSAKKLVVEL